jgi:pilus assembly protein CpaF
VSGTSTHHALERAVHARVLGEPAADVAEAARRHSVLIDPLLPEGERQRVVAGVLARAHGLGPLHDLLADPAVTEIMVNAGRDVWVERHGRLERLPRALSPGEAEVLAERILAPLGVPVDRLHPLADARLPDGSRVHVAIPPVAPDGAAITIRRFVLIEVGLTSFASAAVAALLARAVAERANIVVSGATSSGKTTLLNALAGHCPAGERIVTIEDAAELRLRADHVVRLESRPATTDGTGAVPIRELLRAALRMRPDRIVVGEVRGHESFDAVQAMSTGHDGSLTTVHANGPLDALRRIEAMVLAAEPGLPLVAVREQVHASIDLVVHVERTGDGGRRVQRVAEVVTPDELGDGHERIRLLVDGDVIVARARRASRRGAP